MNYLLLTPPGAGQPLKLPGRLARVFLRGIRVDIVPVGQVKNIGQYQSVILGSAIRFGNWLPPMVEFVKKHQAQLNRVPVACFTVHILALDDSQASQKKRPAYLDKVRGFITPKAEGFK